MNQIWATRVAMADGPDYRNVVAQLNKDMLVDRGVVTRKELIKQDWDSLREESK